MNLRSLSISIFILSVSAALHPLSADTTWTGNTDNEFTDGINNWTNGVPDNSGNPGTIPGGTTNSPLYSSTSGNLSSTNITQTGGTVTFDVSASQVTYQNTATWDLNGGVLAISGANRLSLGSDSTLNVNGGSITQSGGGDLWINTSDASLNILQDLTMSASGLVWQRTGNVTVDNSTFTIGTFQYANNTSTAVLNFQNGGTLDTDFFDYGGGNNTNQGQINFLNGANTLQADTWDKPDEMQFNFASSAVGSSITITTGFYDLTDWQTKWDDGELTVDGGGGTFSDYFTVSGNTLTMVPEPGSLILVGVGLAALVVVRNRRR